MSRPARVLSLTLPHRALLILMTVSELAICVGLCMFDHYALTTGKRFTREISLARAIELLRIRETQFSATRRS